MPLLRMFRVFACCVLTLAAIGGHSQTIKPGNYFFKFQATTPDDFTVDNLKFHRTSSGFMTVVDTTKNQNAGTVIFPPGGAPVFAPMPGYDIKSAYEKHMNGSSTPPTAQPANTSGAGAAPASTEPAASATRYDAASRTVTLSGGRSVKFIDDENAEVKLPGPAGSPKTYELHYHGSSTGGFFKNLAGAHQGRQGESFGGSGVMISLAAENGMPGGQVFDTASGTVFANSGMVQAQNVISAVREARDVVQPVDAHLAQSKVVKSLLANNLGLK
ncbi:MAG TPA: hypothetical protein VKX41_14865 [Alloacidobacterium sp.]|nr:hypothetical protein [Alloacidobacterium sp.]